MILKGWEYAERRRDLPRHSYKEHKAGMGTVYVAKLKVMPRMYLLKIGSTSGDARYRLDNYSLDTLRIVAHSPMHYNYFENEMLLHEFFDKYRVPPKPGSGACHRPELFNISVAYFFKYMPDLLYAKSLDDVVGVKYEHYNTPIYYNKANFNAEKYDGEIVAT